MKLHSFILAATLGLTGAAYASQAATVPATQQPRAAQPQQKVSTTEQKENRKPSALANAGRFALGAGFIALSIFTGLKAQEEYKNGQAISSKAKKLAAKVKGGIVGLADPVSPSLSSSPVISSGQPAPAAATPSLRQRLEGVGGDGRNALKKFATACTADTSPIQTAGWATTSVCSLVLGMRLILQAVGFVK